MCRIRKNLRELLADGRHASQVYRSSTQGEDQRSRRTLEVYKDLHVRGGCRSCGLHSGAPQLFDSIQDRASGPTGHLVRRDLIQFLGLQRSKARNYL